MDESPSLEEFANEASETDTESEPADVEPAVSTYSWSPSGAPCEACGGAAERRWRDGEQFVCPDCKDW